MEIKAELVRPYTEEERINFIIEQNHRNGYTIEERENSLVALGKTDTELLEELKVSKLSENTTKAKQAIDNGYVVFKDAEFETNAQTVGDLTATMLMMQQAGLETYSWLSRDDKVVELSLEDFGVLGGLIAEYKQTVWSVKYIGYKQAIEQAETLEELEAIIIDYNAEEPIEEVEEMENIEPLEEE